MRFVSPLRYPGGKGALADFLGTVITAQRPRCSTYVEPYAGGAGAALRLLLDEYVDEIVLNDLDAGIAAFWRSVFENPAELTAMIQSVEVSVDEWYRQADIYDTEVGDDLELGFATFFLNRTNRSGILNARPIGGLNQTGKWLIGARFNREDLAERIRLICRYKNRVTISERDGAELLLEMIPGGDSLFLYVDPPYTDKGQELYLNDLTWEDHAELAAILTESDLRWLVTYNCDGRIPSELYPGHRCVRFEIKHTAQHQHVGTEFAIFSPTLVVDSLDDLSVGDAHFMKAG